ncbi:phage replisome organizer N-terminal domain-containing protein [Alkalihalobacterium alkalinitrilicum]|uniref:phage replisome organizer N-terminal domain-containing protein n=1 Tax=Alkalihalobacterium alkalinitrilicum TaxID=427920 RepID=UPI0009953C3E|nr:phage replisome organizer N-terminal domain-containing protein [Alkalihalobacterium alkalinitrilicum]
MSEVKWIKLSTQMFDDEKIRLIESMPEADAILVIWIKLLAQAGKTNASGYIYLNENIPYTDEMLSTIFNRPLNTVRLALSTFVQFGMIEINEDKFISITNWEKHQNIHGLEKIREQNRLRKQKERQRKSLSQSSHVTVTQGHATEEELEEDIELEEERDKEKDIPPVNEIVNYLNEITKKNYRATTPKTKTLINARWNEGFRLDDFKRVIDSKYSQWKNDKKMNNYLRPETLFGTKFESYLNEKDVNGRATHSTVDPKDYDLPF